MSKMTPFLFMLSLAASLNPSGAVHAQTENYTTQPSVVYETTMP